MNTPTRRLVRRPLPTVTNAPCSTCLGDGSVTTVEQLATLTAPHDHGYELVYVDEPCPACRGTGVNPARVRRAA